MGGKLSGNLPETVSNERRIELVQDLKPAFHSNFLCSCLNSGVHKGVEKSASGALTLLQVFIGRRSRRADAHAREYGIHRRLSSDGPAAQPEQEKILCGGDGPTPHNRENRMVLQTFLRALCLCL